MSNEVVTSSGADKDPFEGIQFDQYVEIFERRNGAKPHTEGPVPHRQVDQHADTGMWDALYERCFSLPHVSERDSLVVDDPKTRALWLEQVARTAPDDAFIAEREFAHIHTRPDSSMHLQLPLDVAAMAISGGWAELHSIVWLGFASPASVMLFAPRDVAELEVIWALVQESYRFARGEPPVLRFEPKLREGATS